MYRRRTVGKSLHTRKSYQESEQPAGTHFSQISRSYIVLKLPHNPYAHASSSTQCLFSIGHGLHPRNACSQLVTAYTHALLVFRWPWLTPMQCLFSIGHKHCLFSSNHFVDFIYDRMYLSTTSPGLISDQGNILYQAILVSPSSVSFVTFTTSAKVSETVKLFLTLPRYCKTFDSL